MAKGTVAGQATATGRRALSVHAPEVPVASVEVRAAGPDEARDFLDRLEAASEVHPVDEDEQRRLADVTPIRDRDWTWGGHLTLVDGSPVAYAGIRQPRTAPVDPAACLARVDLALDREHPAAADALIAALEDARGHAHHHRADAGDGAGDDAGAPTPGCVQAWLRGATEHDLAAVGRAGFVPVRRLHVMAAPLAVGRGRVEVPEGLRIRGLDEHDPGDTDADAVVALLSAAYPGSDDGWDAPGFAVRRGTDWFRAEDLLLLEDALSGELLGVHWTKRRGGGVGEVHNLALAASARGQGHAGMLLDAGLVHLAEAGCHEVILWVDAENTPALGLYDSRGFVPRWDDVALVG
jgi:mycothiol synthase